MNKTEKKVLNFIQKHKMINEGQTVVLAVSGGADSMCMLYILNSLKKLLKINLVSVHFNHDFRKSADSDESFVYEHSKKLGIECFSKKVNVESYANEKKISFETAGRELRYEFFASVAKKYESAVIATAHNANDNAESFVMHLLRGSGLSGLTGIAPVRDNVIRPILELKREEVESYCAENGIEYVTDETNFSDDYARNDIRHNVLPVLDKRGGTDAILRTAQILKDEEDFLNEYSKNIFIDIVKTEQDKSEIDVKKFNLLPLAIRKRIIRMSLPSGSLDTGTVHIEQAVSIAERNYGGKEMHFPNGDWLVLKNGKIIITKEKREE